MRPNTGEEREKTGCHLPSPLLKRTPQSTITALPERNGAETMCAATILLTAAIGTLPALANDAVQRLLDDAGIQRP